MKKALLAGIRVYQVIISPYVASGLCRHSPSCSAYMMEAIVKYGVFKGVWFGAKRLVRCRPGGSYGYDPLR